MSYFYDPDEYRDFIASKRKTIKGALETRSLIKDFVENKITEDIFQQEVIEKQQKPTTDLLQRISTKLGTDEDIDDKDPLKQQEKRLNNNLGARMQSLSAGLSDIREAIIDSQQPDYTDKFDELKVKFDEHNAGIKKMITAVKNQTPQVIQEVKTSLENLADSLQIASDANINGNDRIAGLIEGTAKQYEKLIEATESLKITFQEENKKAETAAILNQIEESLSKLDAVSGMPESLPTGTAAENTAIKVNSYKTARNNLIQAQEDIKRQINNIPSEMLPDLLPVVKELNNAASSLEDFRKTKASDPSFDSKYAVVQAGLSMFTNFQKELTKSRTNDDEDLFSGSSTPRQSPGKQKVKGKPTPVKAAKSNQFTVVKGRKSPAKVGEGISAPAKNKGKTMISAGQLIELQNSGVSETIVSKNAKKGLGPDKPTGILTAIVRNGRIGDVFIDMPRLTNDLYLIGRMSESGRPFVSRKVDEATRDLLLQKHNPNKTYPPIAWDTLGLLMARSGAQFRGGDKLRLAEPYMTKYLKKNTPTPSNGSGIRFYKNKQELIDRKKVLVGSVNSGNNNPQLQNEISEINTVLTDKK